MKRILHICSFLIILFIPQRCNLVRGRDIVLPVKVKEEVIVPDIVTLTTYSIEVSETDSTPLITASGYKIKPNNPKKQRIIAVSRDLKRKYKFGQKVRIRNAGKYNGVYTVRDVMHHRWKNKIDVLINPNDKDTKLKKVKLYMVKN